jgi:hypothetical protein
VTTVQSSSPTTATRAASTPSRSGPKADQPASATQQVSQAVTSPSRQGLSPVPREFRDGPMDHVRRFWSPGYQSEGDKFQMRQRIGDAAERLRSGQTGGHQVNASLAGMNLDEARKLQEFARNSKDPELQREASFLVQMLTDMRPGPVPVNSGSGPVPRTTPTQFYSSPTQRRCAAAVMREAASEGLTVNDERFVQRVITRCGPGDQKE